MPDVRVEDATGVERVLIGNIGTDDTPNYGLRVTSSDGTTVIIDGTSNMFKIVATGTQSVAYNGNTFTLLSGVTSGSQMLKALFEISTFAGALTFGQNRYDSIEIVPDLTGANVQYYANGWTQGSGTTDIRVYVQGVSGSVNMVGSTAYERYYVLKEVGV